MFETLSDRLGGIFDKLTRRGALSEADVDAAMREVRRALIEADVTLEVVRGFIDRVKSEAVGQEVVKSVTPGQMVVKIVNDALVDVLGSNADPINLSAAPPVTIMMVGLQGSGKTTSSAKISLRLKDREKKKVLMASLDVRRPAAQEQLEILGKQIGVDTLEIIAGQDPYQITERAQKTARTGGYDVLILDTAGRLHIDEELMLENEKVAKIANPHEVLLVADALTGQDAVNMARAFDERFAVTGMVLTRVDGDGRGGAALSMRAVTGKPIKLIGTGEKITELEEFHPERIANRILGMGDVVSLVEKAAETIDAAEAEKIACKMKKGTFDLDDLSAQLQQMQKIGGMSGVLGTLPGVGKIKKQLDGSNLDDVIVKRQLAIISSMTKKERTHPKVMNASRRKRVAAGSGTEVQDVNRLLKMHRQMTDMMKKMGKQKGGMFGNMFGGGGMPDAAKLEKMQAEIGAEVRPGALPPDLKDLAGGALPKKLPSLPGLGGGDLPGLGGGIPRGLPGFGKKGRK